MCNTQHPEIAYAQQVILLVPVAFHLSRNFLPDPQMQVPVSQKLSSCSARGHRDKELRYCWYLPFLQKAGGKKKKEENTATGVLSILSRSTSDTWITPGSERQLH